jgi:hypothetical protein
MTQYGDGKDGKASVRNQADTENSNIEPSISYDEMQSDSDSEVTHDISKIQ